MNYFRQIIFPPIPKKVEEIVSQRFEEDIESNYTFLDLRYWFEYLEGMTKFMVRCPTCGEVYCYSRVTSETHTQDIVKAIKENTKFFTTEWIGNCPKIKDHVTILDSMKGLI